MIGDVVERVIQDARMRDLSVARARFLEADRLCFGWKRPDKTFHRNRLFAYEAWVDAVKKFRQEQQW